MATTTKKIDADSTGQDETVDLTGVWRFQPDAYDDGERMGYQLPSKDVRLWREVNIPCSFDECLSQPSGYEGKGWFRREFTLPHEWLTRHIALHFEGVNYSARVWVNGVLAGEHAGGFLRFDIVVNHLVKPGHNVIVVCVDNTRRHGEAPGVQHRWRTLGGILREVSLACSPLLRIEHVAVSGSVNGKYELSAVACNDTTEDQCVSVCVYIADNENQLVSTVVSLPVNLKPRSNETVYLTGIATGISSWSPDNPTLYSTMVCLVQAEVLHTIRVTTGFRTIAVQGTRLLLNGKPLRLRGFNRHEDTVQMGTTPAPEAAERDLRHMKQLGANFVRLCHHPHHASTLDLCDRLGLLVMEEIPLNWWDSEGDGVGDSQASLLNAKHHLTELVKRDTNHASIISWSVSNESPEGQPDIAAGNEALIDYVHALDSSRLAVHVSSEWSSDPHFQKDDVICINGYPSWEGRCRKANPQYDVVQSAMYWDEQLRMLHERCPNKPVLVTEFGYPALYRTFDNALGEDMQETAIRTEATALDKPYVCGMTLWCYADHAQPEEPFITNMTTSPFGIVTRDRREKRVCEVVRSIYGGVLRRPAEPVVPDNVSVDMYRIHLNDIPCVAFPTGFGIRSMYPNEGGLWEDIWRDAEPFFKIENGLFDKEFGDDLPAITLRCFMITSPDNSAVGTISSWYARDLKGMDWGRIHWVATRRAYQGKGLGRAGLSYALRQMAQWHERAVLGTSTGRIGAIKLYLDFGFMPDLDPPGARDAWIVYRKRLNHPALAILDEDC